MRLGRQGKFVPGGLPTTGLTLGFPGGRADTLPVRQPRGQRPSPGAVDSSGRQGQGAGHPFAQHPNAEPTCCRCPVAPRTSSASASCGFSGSPGSCARGRQASWPAPTARRVGLCGALERCLVRFPGGLTWFKSLQLTALQGKQTMQLYMVTPP